MPPLQLVPPEHLLPHTLQFELSVWGSTHDCPQAIWPATHWLTQAPREQNRLPLQTFPHAPQLAGSLDTSAHCPLHSAGCLPVWHAQTPAAQACPAAHTLPQVPQLAVSP